MEVRERSESVARQNDEIRPMGKRRGAVMATATPNPGTFGPINQQGCSYTSRTKTHLKDWAPWYLTTMGLGGIGTIDTTIMLPYRGRRDTSLDRTLVVDIRSRRVVPLC